MDTDDHSEPGGIMDLGFGQVDQEVAGTPVQDVVKGKSHVGHRVHIQSTGDHDLPPGTDLSHRR
jgi:hypothetical protein